jgi:Flp pilus assembly protein CpaB
MRRSPRVLLAWAAALIVMLATARVVTDDLGSLHRRAHDLGTDIAVVLAARDLPLGMTVGAGDLRVVRRPSTTVSAGALRDLTAAVGRIVAVPMLRDDVVGARHLVAGINGVVPIGRRAVHIVVKDGFQPPVNAVVDVLATFDPSIAAGPGSPGQATVVARGAQVVALAGATASQAAEPPTSTGSGTSDMSGSGVTLLVTEPEARSIAFAASIGEVSLALAPAPSACCAAPGP